MSYFFQDTIFALSSGKVDGAISIIRISGEKAFNIIKNIKDNENKQTWQEIKSKSIIVGKLRTKTRVIDQIVFLTFPNPNSFTGENVVEIICHANKFIVEDIYLFLQNKGFRLAENGEFTKRAFLNNKINLLEAESINKLIAANNNYIKNISLSNVVNYSTKHIQMIKEKLIDIIGKIEVNIDYPEYLEIDKTEYKIILTNCIEIEEILSNSIKKYQFTNFISKNHSVAIVGKPNAGKSTLFNKILNYERSIVSEISGTTRDFVEKVLSIKNNEINMIDTAGITSTQNAIEKKGINKTFEIIKKADLIVYLFTKNSNFKNINLEVKKILKINKNVKCFLSKADEKNPIFNKDKINFIYQEISVKNNELDPIYELINNFFHAPKNNDGDIIFFSTRHYQLINECYGEIKKAIWLIKRSELLEVIVINLKKIYANLNELIGIDVDDELIDQIFNKFCLGK